MHKIVKSLALLSLLLFFVISVFIFFIQDNDTETLYQNEIIASNKQASLLELNALAIEGVPEAMGRLAREYYRGLNVHKNDKKAFYWAFKGYSAGDGQAAILLSHMYLYGESTEVNLKKAVAVLSTFKDRELEARYLLGKIYLEHYKSDVKLLGKGLSEVREAADRGLPQAQFDMAVALMVGSMKTSDVGIDSLNVRKQSSEYLAMAVAQDYAPAMRLLGLYFYNGFGVSIDKEKALSLLSSAAALGDAKSALILKEKMFNLSDVDH